MMMQGVEVLLEQAEFVAIAAVVLLLAYLALEHKEITYAVFFFGFMAAAVSGFFLLLDAPFLVGLQIGVYTGGISALIIFGVLLLPRAQDSSLEVFQTPRRRRFGLLLSGVVMFLSAVLAFFYPWSELSPVSPPELPQSLQGLAAWLWSGHGIYVEMVALIMLTALVGSVAILKMMKAEELHPLSAKSHAEPTEKKPDVGSVPASQGETGEEPKEVGPK
jgi:NADH:ubiquinone oxidoreductase subunit 6 (subunit J)